jgi:ribosomal protein S18 acetylase RimI-like enzyme
VTSPPFRVEMLASHDRSSFDCGNERIDRYFRETVSQDVKRDYVRCFVAIDVETERLAGFYTLSANGIPLTDIPNELKKKMPRYPSVPVGLIGWMGRHLDFAGRGLGEALLFDAIQRIAGNKTIGLHAIVVDAIDDRAMKFYRDFGFISLSAEAPKRLYLPVATALKAIRG